MKVQRKTLYKINERIIKMSRWTHIAAVLHIDTDVMDKNIEDLVSDKIKNAPAITGSERNVDIFVNVLSGHNTSIYNNGMWEKFQTCLVITIVGDLRNRTERQTTRDYKKFTKYLTEDCDFDVYNEAVNIKANIFGE
jgi:hypothetical protein